MKKYFEFRALRNSIKFQVHFLFLKLIMLLLLPVVRVFTDQIAVKQQKVERAPDLLSQDGESTR